MSDVIQSKSARFVLYNGGWDMERLTCFRDALYRFLVAKNNISVNLISVFYFIILKVLLFQQGVKLGDTEELTLRKWASATVPYLRSTARRRAQASAKLWNGSQVRMKAVRLVCFSKSTGTRLTSSEVEVEVDFKV